jgi:hypothetical protein
LYVADDFVSRQSSVGHKFAELTTKRKKQVAVPVICSQDLLAEFAFASGVVHVLIAGE